MKVGLGGERVRSSLLATRIRAIRESIGMPPAVLAARVGVCRTTLLQWENRRCEPSLCVIEKLAETLGTTPEFLAFGPAVWSDKTATITFGIGSAVRPHSLRVTLGADCEERRLNNETPTTTVARKSPEARIDCS